jgi:hypothetical protein
MDATYSEETFHAEELADAERPGGDSRRLAMSDQPDRSNPRSLDAHSDDVESASIDSFPASDPPKWSGLRLGPPVHSEPEVRGDKKETEAHAHGGL